MTTYYRLSQDDWLPSEWAYGDPDEGTSPGFQVWITLGEAIRALAGEDLDGLYPASEYPVLFSVTVSEVDDGGSMWFAVQPENIRQLRRMSSLKAVDWVVKQTGATNCDLDDLASWLSDDANQEKVARYVKRNSIVVRPKFRSGL
jgi:hypothetical protein